MGAFRDDGRGEDMSSKPMPAITLGRVLENRTVAGATFLMVIECPAASGALPGQFVKFRTWAEPDQGGSPFLDRPFSIHRVDGDRLSLLYRVVGPATKIMSEAQLGSPVKVSGPLGRGLPEVMDKPMNMRLLGGGMYLPEACMYLVAGGIGLAPMALALDWLGGSGAATLFYGERSGDLQVEETWLKSWAGDVVARVDDGSGYGRPGLVTAPLEEALAREVRPIFACGPAPMLAAVSALAARYEAPCLVSVEAGMACGFGVCLTCSLPLKSGGRFRACQEGPVVDGSTINWDKVRV